MRERWKLLLLDGAAWRNPSKKRGGEKFNGGCSSNRPFLPEHVQGISLKLRISLNGKRIKHVILHVGSAIGKCSFQAFAKQPSHNLTNFQLVNYSRFPDL